MIIQKTNSSPCATARPPLCVTVRDMSEDRRADKIVRPHRAYRVSEKRTHLSDHEDTIIWDIQQSKQTDQQTTNSTNNIQPVNMQKLTVHPVPPLDLPSMPPRGHRVSARGPTSRQGRGAAPCKPNAYRTEQPNNGHELTFNWDIQTN